MTGPNPSSVVHKALIDKKPAGPRAFWMPGEIPGVAIGALITAGYRLVHESEDEKPSAEPSQDKVVAHLRRQARSNGYLLLHNSDGPRLVEAVAWALALTTDDDPFDDEADVYQPAAQRAVAAVFSALAT